jgi:hypothetical protein
MSTPTLFFNLFTARPSPLHGLGVFATRYIPAGTIWWTGEPDQNIVFIEQAQYNIFQKSADNNLKTNFLHFVHQYGYYAGKLDCLILCLDDARYLNHAPNPNSGTLPDGNPLASVALRNIAKGEEITENYELYDSCPWVPELVTQGLY